MAYGGKLYPGYIGSFLLGRVDLYLVALFQGAAITGIYVVAKGLADVVALIEPAISMAVMPEIVGSGHDRAAEISSRAFRLSFWGVAAISLVGIFLSPWIFPLLYGDEFSSAGSVFVLLLPGVVALTTRVLGTFFSMQMGRPEIPTIYTIGTGLLTIPIAYYLTRQFGCLGTAVAFSLVGILRGMIVIGLFLFFSGSRLKSVILPMKEDFVLITRFLGQLASVLGMHLANRGQGLRR
jgi:O-antigen/teichoic acid export membrane protein